MFEPSEVKLLLQLNNFGLLSQGEVDPPVFTEIEPQPRKHEVLLFFFLAKANHLIEWNNKCLHIGRFGEHKFPLDGQKGMPEMSGVCK